MSLAVNKWTEQVNFCQHLLFGRDSLSKWEDPWGKTVEVWQAFVGSFYELGPGYKMKQAMAVSHSQGSRETVESQVMSENLGQS